MADKSTKGNAFDMGLFKRLMQQRKPYNRTFWWVFLSAIILSGVAVLRPILLGEAIDEYIQNRDRSGFVLFVGLMLTALIAEVILQFLFVYFANWLGQHVITDMRKQLFDKIISFKKKYFDKVAVGRLVTRAVSDIQTISRIFSEGLFIIASDMLKMLAVLVAMIVINWELTLITLTVLPVILIATRWFQKAMKKAFEDVRAEVANIGAFVQERVTGMKIVQLFSREKTEYENFRTINDRHRKAWVKTVWYNSIFFPIAELSSSVVLGLLLWYSGILNLGSESFTVPVIVMFTEFARMLFQPLRQIADKFNTLQMGMVASRRVFDILDEDSQIEDTGNAIATDLQGAIEFNAVDFQYVEGEPVLRGLDFNVKPGETIAIVGPTGAGKSTIINLISRFYEINSGSIKLDGTDIRKYTLTSLRDQVAVVLQDVFLFADTIYNNITLGNPEVTREQVLQAAKDIGVHDFISSLPGGYEYNVKERGVMLSSGQRQLISFLRAYVSNPSILILDEATSSVDTYSEQLIQRATNKLSEGRTSIIIAHRLVTIKNADRIIVLEDGKLMESGSHDELLRIPSGHYRNLYDAQFVEQEVA